VSSLRFVRYPDRESWLEARRLSIGSSDAPALMGESSWASPVTLNYSKRGILPPAAPDETREEELDWHRTRENEIATWWWERQQVRVPELAFRRVAPKCFVWNPGDFTVGHREVDGIPLSATFDRLLVVETDATRRAADFAHCSDDALAKLASNVVAAVELKNASAYMGKHWEEEPPLIYQLQLQHQLLVAGVSPGYLVASIGGQPPVWAQILRDGEICGILRSTYARFWASVVGDCDLPADYKEVTGKAITARYPEDDGATVALGLEEARWWSTRCNAAASIKANEELKDEATNNIKQAMGPATFGLLPDGSILSLKANKKGQRNLRLFSSEENGAPAREEEFSWR
jgi:predicted phage-related endonuclease